MNSTLNQPYSSQIQNGQTSIASWKQQERTANTRVSSHINDVTHRPSAGDGINSLKYATRSLQGVTSHQAQQMRMMETMIEAQHLAIERLAEKAKLDLDA